MGHENVEQFWDQLLPILSLYQDLEFIESTEFVFGS